MLNKTQKYSIQTVILLAILTITGCSQVGQFSRTGGSSNVDNSLIIPPSLRLPAETSVATPTSRNTNTTANRQNQPRRKIAARPNSNFYIIVGTYPDQLDALDTFTRISSIGLKGATMESRRTKAGNLLHMVRLGPYTQQEDIDKAKDSLTSTGLSQFKIVKN